MDQIDTVRAFLEVAERQSFTAAAARLGLSKALVSKQVAALEARAGTRLLNRTTRRVALTGAGEAFLARARETVAAWDAMFEAASEDSAGPRGHLRVAGPRVFGETVLAPMLAGFLAARPGLTAELAVEERRVDLVGEGYDLAVRIGSLADSGLVAVALGDYPYVICASADYLARAGTPERPEDLTRHDCIVTTPVAPTGHWEFRDGSATVRVAVRTRVRVNADQAAAAFVRAGLGVGLLFRRPLEPEIAAGRIVPLLAGFHVHDRPIHALLPHRTGLPARTRHLLEFLRQHLRPLRGAAD